MPTISVDRDALFDRLGKRYTQEEFEKLCFEFGIELDEVEEEGCEAAAASSSGAGAQLSPTKTIYKIEVAANRYDMLCIEGIARALRVFLELDEAPVRMIAPHGCPTLTMQNYLVPLATHHLCGASFGPLGHCMQQAFSCCLGIAISSSPQVYSLAPPAGGAPLELVVEKETAVSDRRMFFHVSWWREVSKTLADEL